MAVFHGELGSASFPSGAILQNIGPGFIPNGIPLGENTREIFHGDITGFRVKYSTEFSCHVWENVRKLHGDSTGFHVE